MVYIGISTNSKPVIRLSNLMTEIKLKHNIMGCYLNFTDEAAKFYNVPYNNLGYTLPNG